VSSKLTRNQNDGAWASAAGFIGFGSTRHAADPQQQQQQQQQPHQ